MKFHVLLLSALAMAACKPRLAPGSQTESVMRDDAATGGKVVYYPSADGRDVCRAECQGGDAPRCAEFAQCLRLYLFEEQMARATARLSLGGAAAKSTGEAVTGSAMLQADEAQAKVLAMLDAEFQGPSGKPGKTPADLADKLKPASRPEGSRPEAASGAESADTASPGRASSSSRLVVPAGRRPAAGDETAAGAKSAKVGDRFADVKGGTYGAQTFLETIRGVDVVPAGCRAYADRASCEAKTYDKEKCAWVPYTWVDGKGDGYRYVADPAQRGAVAGRCVSLDFGSERDPGNFRCEQLHGSALICNNVGAIRGCGYKTDPEVAALAKARLESGKFARYDDDPLFGVCVPGPKSYDPRDTAFPRFRVGTYQDQKTGCKFLVKTEDLRPRANEFWKITFNSLSVYYRDRDFTESAKDGSGKCPYNGQSFVCDYGGIVGRADAALLKRLDGFRHFPCGDLGRDGYSDRSYISKLLVIKDENSLAVLDANGTERSTLSFIAYPQVPVSGRLSFWNLQSGTYKYRNGCYAYVANTWDSSGKGSITVMDFVNAGNCSLGVLTGEYSCQAGSTTCQNAVRAKNGYHEPLRVTSPTEFSLESSAGGESFSLTSDYVEKPQRY